MTHNRCFINSTFHSSATYLCIVHTYITCWHQYGTFRLSNASSYRNIFKYLFTVCLVNINAQRVTHQHTICRIFPGAFIFTKCTATTTVCYVHAMKCGAPCKFTGHNDLGASRTYQAHRSLNNVFLKNNEKFNLIYNSNLLKT